MARFCDEAVLPTRCEDVGSILMRRVVRPPEKIKAVLDDLLVGKVHDGGGRYAG